MMRLAKVANKRAPILEMGLYTKEDFNHWLARKSKNIENGVDMLVPASSTCIHHL
jgi:hypothetical protein